MTRESLAKILALAGLGALAVGAALSSVEASAGWVAIVLVAGALSVVAGALVNARGLTEFTRSRSARYGTNALLMTVFFTAILVVAQAVSVRNRDEFDFTRNQRYTLAPQTTSVLDALDRDVQVTAFFRRGSQEEGTARMLLDMYERSSHRFHYEFVDPDRRPDLASRLGATYQNVVVQAGDRHRRVKTLTEASLTNAIVQVTRGREKTIYFVTGHAEKSLASSERDGYTSVRKGLVSQGYRVSDLSLLHVDRVPADASALVIAGPRKPYLGVEIDRLSGYLRRGGSVLFLLDPRIDLPGIESVLARYHIHLPPLVMLDPVSAGDPNFDATVAKVRRYEPHEITRGFNAITMYPMVRPVQIVKKPPDVRVEASYLAVTDRASWGETDMESFAKGEATRGDNDVPGPLPIAAAVTLLPPPHNLNEPAAADSIKESRIVVFGDSDFVSNAYYGLLGNSDLFLNSLGFLARDTDLINIRPKQRMRDRVYITAAQGRFIFTVCVLLLPLSVVVMGVSVFLRRRRA